MREGDLIIQVWSSTGWRMNPDLGYTRVRDEAWADIDTADWVVGRVFESEDNAIEVADDLAFYNPGKRFRVKRWHGNAIYTTHDTTHEVPQEEQVSLNPYTGQGDLEQPLHIPRQTLIDTLQSNLDAEQKKREDAASRKKENRDKIATAIRSFSDDELVNFFTQNVALPSTFDMVQWVERAQEDKQYATPEEQPSKKEDSLEKYVRVLGMATDQEIEVKPNDPIYPLL